MVGRRQRHGRSPPWSAARSDIVDLVPSRWRLGSKPSMPLAFRSSTSTTTPARSPIESADVDTITVRARIGHGLRRSGSSVNVEGDRLIVRGSCPIFGSQWCDVRYTIEVPGDVDVVVSGDNDGIRVAGIDGRVELHSDNGSIRATDITGDDRPVVRQWQHSCDRIASVTPFEATSDNGDVDIELLVAPPERQCDVGQWQRRGGSATRRRGLHGRDDHRQRQHRQRASVRCGERSARDRRTDNGDVTLRYSD